MHPHHDHPIMPFRILSFSPFYPPTILASPLSSPSQPQLTISHPQHNPPPKNAKQAQAPTSQPAATVARPALRQQTTSKTPKTTRRRKKSKRPLPRNQRLGLPLLMTKKKAKGRRSLMRKATMEQKKKMRRMKVSRRGKEKDEE